VEIISHALEYRGRRAELVMARDVTDQITMEKVLRRREGFFSNVLDSIQDGISILDRDLRIIRVNRTMEQRYQHRVPLVGQKCYEAYHGRVDACEQCPSRKTLQDGAHHVDIVPYSRPEDRRGWLELHSFPLRSTPDAELEGVIEYVRDITERKRMEEQMLRVQKLESPGILAGGIAHDFNNLLTGVLGNVSVARKHLEADGFASERLVRAEKASLRAKDLTQQLLTFASGGAPQKKIVASGELISESVQLGLRGSNNSYRLSLAEELWPIEADPGQISQVIHNLVINAEQAMPEGGMIAVTGDNATLQTGNAFGLKEGMYIRLHIQDQGEGIPEEHLCRIFDPFFTTKEAGSGLGLSISYSIVTRHGGLLTVNSQKGRGTECRVWLPATEKRVDPAEALPERDVAGRKRRILVMDDERVIRDVATPILRREGYEVSRADKGQEAIQIYREGQASGKPFDCVILDLTIPGGMGGKETIRKLKEIDPNLIAVVSSGYSNDPVLADFADAGFSGAVQKPYTADEMLEAVARVLEEGS
jgi:PAS domain S-box-containing protein